MSQEIVNKIVEDLTKNGFEVFDHYLMEDKNYVIFAEKMVLHYDVSSKILIVSFLISAVPDFVGNAILVLDKIKKIRVEVAESFYYGKNNEIFTGEAAHKTFNQTVTDQTIEAFIREQSQINLLRSGNCYKA